jgi:hypothetical protein
VAARPTRRYPRCGAGLPIEGKLAGGPDVEEVGVDEAAVGIDHHAWTKYIAEIIAALRAASGRQV